MNVLISGADRGLGLSLTAKMLARGYTVFAGQYLSEWDELSLLCQKFPNTLHLIPLDVGCDESVKNACVEVEKITSKLDVIIGNAAIIGWIDDVMTDVTDTEMMAEVYNVNAIGNVRLFEYFLPLLKKGHEKKICFISSEAGSIGECERKSFFWYGMTKSAVNYYAKVMYNRHRTDNFKFRLYHPGWIQTYMKGPIDEYADLTPDEAAVFAMDYFFDQIINEDQLILQGYDGKIFEF